MDFQIKRETKGVSLAMIQQGWFLARTAIIQKIVGVVQNAIIAINAKGVSPVTIV